MWIILFGEPIGVQKTNIRQLPVSIHHLLPLESWTTQRSINEGNSNLIILLSLITIPF